ncbi:MAG: hypothetical protein QNJ98_09120 [Planctomycetota bacterium]|nr:hypothetical protein [Planctomycetota bacterium]
MSRRFVLLSLFAVLLLLAPPAEAETLVLKSGKKVKAASVELEDDAVVATLHVDGGTAIVRYRFDRLEPFHLIDLLERRLIVGQDAKADGAAALQIAAIAKRHGLLDEAVVWLSRAAEIDPALVPKRDAGLETIRTARVNGAFGVLEDLMRAKQPEKLIDAADEVLAGELGLLLTPAEALRVGALRGLAVKLAAKGKAPVPAAAAPAAPAGLAPAAGLDAKTVKALDRVDAALGKATAARDKATDPGISNVRARKLLETGAKSLLDARRLLRELAAPLPAPALDRAIAVDEALITTWLDVAELYHEANRFQTARRFLRAARLLDPENERAREIEIKLETPRPVEPPYEPTTLDYLYYPSGYTLWGGAPYRYRSTYLRYGSSYLRYGNLGFRACRHYGCRIGGHGHHHHRGSHRVVGRRR